MNADESDEALVERTLAGDTGAFGVLVRRYRRPAVARALAVLLNPEDAEDVAQEAFVRAYEQLALCRQPSRFGGWLMTIVYRNALNAARADRRRRVVALDDTIVAPAQDFTRTLETRDLRTALLRGLETLTLVQRSVVVFADLEGWEHARIAAELNISVVMSRRHLSDARRQLRAILPGLSP